MSENRGESVVPVDPNNSALHRELVKEKVKEEAKKEEERVTDERMSRIRDEEEALAFAAGLSREEFRSVFQTYGPEFGSHIFQTLVSRKASSVEKATQVLYEEAGDQAGLYADWLAKISSQKIHHPAQPETPWEQLNKDISKHDNPQLGKRRKRPTKGQIIAKAEKFQKRRKLEDEQNTLTTVTPQDDAAFDALQKSSGLAKKITHPPKPKGGIS